ncbi:MAG TPA: hypothetical protein VGN37_19745, partial [Actinocatenispora sp.]
MYGIGFDDNRTFHVVASDGGLLDRPAATRRCRISPGERFEIVVEFAPGETVLLTSRAGDSDIESGDYNLLKLVAARKLTPSRGAGDAGQRRGEDDEERGCDRAVAP